MLFNLSFLSSQYLCFLSNKQNLFFNSFILFLQFDRYIFDKRLDVGVFQTNSFQKDFKFAGIPTLETLVTSDQTNFDICLALSLVNEQEKTVNQFTTGFLRVKN